MSSTAVLGYNSGYTSGLDSLGGVGGSDNQNEIEQFLELLIQELQQILSQSQGSGSGDDGVGGVGGGGSGGGASPASFAPPPAPAPVANTGGGSGGGGGAGGGGGSVGGVGGGGGGAGSGSGAPPTLSGGDAASQITQNLEQRYGLNAAQAAGVLGNLQQESGLQGDINQGGAKGAPSGNFADDNGNGWGLAQWGGARKQGEINYAHDHGLDPGSLQANIGYMDQELDTTYSKTISDIKNDSTPEQAALDWDKDFEQASDPQMQNRDQYAEQFFQQGL
ncbi:phage tail tip lysozyme [Trinickia dabaoshanensis]|uniref:phage tail tip lysozyme n=1 Tax=Trinickia dabaoshanensis TaxID=564714 RepID=UPI0011AF8EF5|nr:phage tail tip lysozyme [Trinickia dabaoshanensis]